jgi:uncharacterized membrane protein YbaN (DUF454 family)
MHTVLAKCKEWAKRFYAKLERYPRVRTVLGITLLIMAVIGALLPLLQGWIFFAAAVGVLGIDHPVIRWCFRQLEWLRPLLEWFRRQWQKVRPFKAKDAPPGGPNLRS